jgi:hypothetical protein
MSLILFNISSLPHVSITKPERLMLSVKVTSVCLQNHREHINIPYGKVSMFNVNVLICACCKHCALNGRGAKNLFTTLKKYIFQNAQEIKVKYNIIRITHFYSSIISILNS